MLTVSQGAEIVNTVKVQNMVIFHYHPDVLIIYGWDFNTVYLFL